MRELWSKSLRKYGKPTWYILFTLKSMLLISKRYDTILCLQYVAIVMINSDSNQAFPYVLKAE